MSPSPKPDPYTTVDPTLTRGVTHTQTSHGCRVVHTHWFNSRDYCAYAKAAAPYSRYGSAFNLRRGLDILEHGDESLVAGAQEHMNKIQANLPSVANKWHLSVAGAFPNVPAYLSNQPAAMYMRRRVYTDNAPLRIWIEVSPSARVNREQLLARGAILVALVMLLSQRRSQVILTPYSDLASYEHGSLVSWDLSSQPLVLSEVCASLGQPEVVRDVALMTNSAINSRIGGGWLRGHEPTYGFNEAIIRTDLNANPGDLIIPGPDICDPLLNDPIEWINTVLAKTLEERTS